MFASLPTPALVVDAAMVQRNLERMADYTRAHRLHLRPHTKTHKSALLARLQLDHGAAGLAVAKPGEAQVMSSVGDDILVAYTTVDPQRWLAHADGRREPLVPRGYEHFR